MSVKYSVVAKKNPRDPEAPAKYYPSVKAGGHKSVRQIGRQIAEISTVSSVNGSTSPPPKHPHKGA
jgi:hypothetical protein